MFSLILSSPARRLDCADDPSFSIAGDTRASRSTGCADRRGFSAAAAGAAAADGRRSWRRARNRAAMARARRRSAPTTPTSAAGVDDDKAVSGSRRPLAYACLDGGSRRRRRLLAACRQSCPTARATSRLPAPPRTSSYSDGGLFSYGDDYEPPKPHSQEDCQSLCKPEWLSDGECDYECNALDCGWDGNDCYHGNTGCYVHPTGADYRGMANTTVSGKDCQYWSSLWPNEHTYVPSTYPDANLGGHNHCRNPEPGERPTGPWCMVNSFDVKWEYCDVGPVHDA